MNMQEAYAHPAFQWQRPFFRYLDTVGDGSGTKNANGNYSDGGLGLTKFLLAPPADEIFVCFRVMVTIQDSGAPGFNSGGYGGLAALTNGIHIHVEDADGGVLFDLNDDTEIRTNAQWAQLCYDVNHLNFGTGEELVAVRWTFANTGSRVVLNGDHGMRLAVHLNDDLSGLTNHYFMVQGYRSGG